MDMSGAEADDVLQAPVAAVFHTVELLEGVLQFLSPYDLMHRVQLVCQSWKATIEHSILLRRVLWVEPSGRMLSPKELEKMRFNRIRRGDPREKCLSTGFNPFLSKNEVETSHARGPFRPDEDPFYYDGAIVHKDVRRPGDRVDFKYRLAFALDVFDWLRIRANGDRHGLYTKAIVCQPLPPPDQAFTIDLHFHFKHAFCDRRWLSDEGDHVRIDFPSGLEGALTIGDLLENNASGRPHEPMYIDAEAEKLSKEIFEEEVRCDVCWPAIEASNWAVHPEDVIKKLR